MISAADDDLYTLQLTVCPHVRPGNAAATDQNRL